MPIVLKALKWEDLKIVMKDLIFKLSILGVVCFATLVVSGRTQVAEPRVYGGSRADVGRQSLTTTFPDPKVSAISSGTWYNVPHFTKSRDDFKFLFNLYQGGNQMDDFMIFKVRPYLRDGDVINIVTGNGVSENAIMLEQNARNSPHRNVDMNEVNQRLNKLRKTFSGICLKYTIYTAGLNHIKEVAGGLTPENKTALTGIFYGYEPNYLSEFQYDIKKSVEHVRDAAHLIREAGFLAGSAPTGRGLSESTEFTGWNYRLFADQTDMLIVQTQTFLKTDYINNDMKLPKFKSVIALLKQELAEGHQSSCIVYPQVTTSPSRERNNGNGAPAQYCVAAVRVILDGGFKGASLWFGDSVVAMDSMLAIVKAFRSPR